MRLGHPRGMSGCRRQRTASPSRATRSSAWDERYERAAGGEVRWCHRSATPPDRRPAEMSVPMNPTPINLTVASSQADAAAVDAVEEHHAHLADELAALVEALLAAASTTSSNIELAQIARQRLVEFCATQLMPHAEAEERALYPAAAQDPRAKLLVESMIAEHRMLRLLVDEVAATTRPVAAAALAMALRVLFDVHLAKENELILPLVAADPAVSLAQILSGMHELLGHAAQGCGHGGCGCAEDDEACGCGSGEAECCGPDHGHQDGADDLDESRGGCGCGQDGSRTRGASESRSTCTCGCGGHGGSDEVIETAPATAVEPGPEPAGAGACGCGEHDDESSPVLDVRQIPHAIRHATVFGAVAAVPSGASLVLVAPHDPLPLLAQLDAREPHTWSVAYQQRGPESWRLLLTRG